MDDLSEKLAEILNNPESMNKVKAMAENILGKDEPKENHPSTPDFSDFLKAGEMSSLISIISKLKASGNDPRAQLLNALKPHLSDKRQEKVDTAIKILKVIEVLPLMRESGILNL